MPAFMFHEGGDPLARNAFEQIARLTGGACCSFDASSADQLRTLLAAVAVFAAGGLRALEDYGRRHGGEGARLSGQLRALPGRRCRFRCPGPPQTDTHEPRVRAWR